MAVWERDDISGNTLAGSGAVHENETLCPNPEKWQLSRHVIGTLLCVIFLALIAYCSHVPSASTP